MSGQSLRASPLDRSEPIERASLDELEIIVETRTVVASCSDAVGKARGPSDQVAGRGHGQGPCGRAGQHRTFPRQGQARH